MRIVSARWVVPIDRPPRLRRRGRARRRRHRAHASDRAPRCAPSFPARPRSAPRARSCPGPRQRPLPPRALGAGRGGSGRRRLHRLGRAVPEEGRRDAARRCARDAAAEAAAAAARFGTAAIGDVGNTLDAAPGHRRRGPRAASLFHELLGSREAKHRRRARRRRPRARAEAKRRPGPPTSATCARRTPPTPSTPTSCGASSPPRAAQRACHLHPRRRGRGRGRACSRDGTRRAGPACSAAMGIDAATRVPGRSPVAYLASLGAFDGPAPPLLVHMVHAGAEDRRIAREAGATVVLCPRSNLHIGGRLADVPALLDDGVALALGTDSLASTPDLSLLGEIATLAAALPGGAGRCAGSRPPPAAARRRCGSPAYGTLAPGPAPRPARRAASTISRRLSNRWSAIRTPPCAGWPAHDHGAPARRHRHRHAHGAS